MFYDRFVYLCTKKGISPSKAALDAGISKSLVTKWKKNATEIPSSEVIVKLSEYFGISRSELLDDTTSPVAFCNECGLRYNAMDEEEVIRHRIRHSAWEKAVEKFGFCWEASYRESIKEDARKWNHFPGTPIEDKIDSQILILKAHFSRSLEASNYNLNHVAFDEYAAMLLNQESIRSGMEPEVYEALVSRFGKQEGIPQGTYFVIKEKAPQRDDAAEELSDYYALTEENKKKAQEFFAFLLSKQ